MSARANVIYDSQYLRDVLLIEGASLVGKGEGRVYIGLDDDNLLDSLVEVLTKEQRARNLRVKRASVERLEAKRRDAIAARQRRHADWKAADDHERAVHHELHVVQQELKALEGES